MPLIEYTKRNFHPGRRAIIAKANQIINDWSAKGFKLTLRQIYYRFIALDWLPEDWIDPVYNAKHGLDARTKNTLRNYKALGDILNDARLAGLVDWDSMEDRTRNLMGLQRWQDPAQALAWLSESYRVDRQKSQPVRIEVWIEKDALAGIFERVCTEKDIDVDYFSCRGYNSQSAMWEASQRILKREQAGQSTIILQFSDHDPSGLDMARDIKERLEIFNAHAVIKRQALTIKQVKRLKLPPNPAKETDCRFAAYLKKFGASSWELDALEPDMLADPVRRAVKTARDPDKWDKATKRELSERRKIKKLSIGKKVKSKRK